MRIRRPSKINEKEYLRGKVIRDMPSLDAWLLGVQIWPGPERKMFTHSPAHKPSLPAKDSSQCVFLLFSVLKLGIRRQTKK